MVLKNFHTHTNYCDGRNTAEEMIEAAISLGFTALGFSGHAYTDFDGSYCMTREGTAQYFDEINALKEKYKGKINVYCGTEQDLLSLPPEHDFDFTLGSVHYIQAGGKYWNVDSSADEQLRCAGECFGGDLMAYCEEYFRLVGSVIETTHADFIGHFDLVSKFNEGDKLFDSHNPRYVKAWQEAADRLCKAGVPFEINTGAIARKLRTEPYPTLEMAEFIHQRGGTFLINSDCHYRERLIIGLKEAAEAYSAFRLIDFEELIRK